MENFISTYRIQFHQAYNFSEFRKRIRYLQNLGISTVYASPVFKAVSGSNHGYDALDPNQLNPEIGTLEEFEKLREECNRHGLNWLQDIVPNHMGFFPENEWIADLLEKGPMSLYSAYFDTAWSSSFYQGSLMVPFLGGQLHEVIEQGELKLVLQQGKLYAAYFETLYPLQPRTYFELLEQLEEKSEAVRQLIRQLDDLHHVDTPQNFRGQWQELVAQFSSLLKQEAFSNSLNKGIDTVNADPSMLMRIMEQQHYRLCHWQETDGNINYRRFFTVNSLICLNIQHEEVFQHHHGLVLELAKKGLVNGLRIDHIDGLFDPAQYLEKLKKETGGKYVVVEKILEPGEQLPETWPCEGTSGYDFLAMVNNLFTYGRNEEKFTRYYNTITGEHRSVAQQVRDKKSLILYHQMGGELENLYRLLHDSGLVTAEDYAQMRTEDIKTAIAEFLIHCPVYRYYGNSFPPGEEEKVEIEKIFSQVRSGRPDLEPAIALLESILLHNKGKEDEEYKAKALYFYQRCMQFTGPLMAKGVEDTLMYTYNRFVAHNEVGDAPDAFGLDAGAFHQAMQERRNKWPAALNGTSTHDTKRGEDVRARLNVISELPDTWKEAVEEWRTLNAPLKTEGAPDINDEYFIYQTLAGSWPMEAEPDLELYKERLEAYFEKAFREAKRLTNWTSPNAAYELAVKNFVNGLLDPSHGFIKSFTRFLDRIIDHGIINSLSQVILKIACPGIPDIYQGCELWDLSLVDPDNRRPVDFDLREEMLDQVQEEKEFHALWNERRKGSIKLWLTAILLNLRKEERNIFQKGEYIPLQVSGRYSNHVLAFARRLGGKEIVFVLPLFTATLCRQQQKQFFELDWEDTSIELEGSGYAMITGNKDEQNEISKTFPVGAAFAKAGLIILKGAVTGSKRTAGILLHISSLPSPYAIGDLGEAAYRFADALAGSRQSLWQLLPINPVEEGQGYSPYSATSTFAGNTLFISPELMIADGLLNEEEVKSRQQPQQGITDYQQAAAIREDLLERAFSRFSEGGGNALHEAFEKFKNDESFWLDDFSLFMLLKQQNNHSGWSSWPEPYRKRDPQKLEALSSQHSKALEKIKFSQFIFYRQWRSLKEYCNSLGIRIMGDLPFYVSYDSADVWSHPDLFCIADDGSIEAMAGVPPDDFSAEGQLWGMPIYDWDKMKEQDYLWWKQRLKKNEELFDLLRLDHFRAFEAYWEVPAGEETAKNGKWIKGPGKEFFEMVLKELDQLELVAEDLGDITPGVYALRDEFNFPGMKVLQFAFGENFYQSEHIPHLHGQNFISYTGTHDNNTTLGWWKQEAGEATKKAFFTYLGRTIPDEQVAETFCRIAMGSVSRHVIIPIQDILGIDEMGRMNTPSKAAGNWGWRLVPGQFGKKQISMLRSWTRIYFRG